MPKLPDKNSLGGPSSFRSGRSIITAGDARADVSGVGAMGKALGRGAQRIGGAISAISEDVQKEQDSLDLIKADAHYKKNMIDAERTFDNDPDYSSYDTRLQPLAGTITEDSANIIRNPKLREKFAIQKSVETAGVRDRVLDKGSTLERQAKIVDVESALGTHQSIYTDPKSDDRRRSQAISDIEASISAAERGGLIDPNGAQGLREKFVRGSQLKDAETRINLGDDSVVEDLERSLNTPRVGPTSNNIKLHDDGMATVTTGSGAKFRVGGTYADRFSGALADLQAAGLDIKADQSGGYANRNIRGTGTPSQHKFGRAIDINWTENARGTPGQIDPQVAREVAKKWGLKWGGDWKNPDPMHFEVDPNATVNAKPPAVAERGLTRYAGVQPKGTMTDAGPAAAPDKPNRYGDIPPDVLSKLLKEAQRGRDVRNQERLWDYKQQIEDDVRSRRETGKGRDGLDLDSIRRTVEPSVWNKYVNDTREADMEFEAARDIPAMSDDQIRNHLDAIVPEPGSEDYGMRASVYDKVKKKADDIRELRAKDPAQSVNSSPEVQGVVKRLQETGVQDQGAIVKARLAAQSRIGIAPQDQSPITKAEAKALLDLPEQRWSMNEGDYLKKLRAAADRAEQEYGPLVAADVFKAAVGFDLKDKSGTDAASGILTKMVKNQAVTADDVSRMNELQNIDAIGRTFDATLTPSIEAERPTISPNFSRDDLQFVTQNAAEIANRKPNAAQEQWARDNPDGWQAFDLRFGKGAAARALGQKPKAK
jgi:hypothetical protein